jgi:hypothetical protein
MRRRDKLTLLPKSPLLITESADEFDAVRDAFEQEIKPHGIMPSKKIRARPGRRRDEFGLTKVRSTQAHSGL